MMIDPEVRISGRLRDSLAELRALTDDQELCDLVDAGQEHASIRTLVHSGLRGLERYLKEEANGLVTGDAVTPPRARTRSRSASPRKVSEKQVAGNGVELAERSLAVIDATLSSAAHCSDFQSSLAAQEGLAHFRDRIRAAVENLSRQDHRGILEKLVESLCHELRLRLGQHGAPRHGIPDPI